MTSIILFLMMLFSGSALTASAIHRILAYAARDDEKSSSHIALSRGLFRTGIVVAFCAAMLNFIWS